MDVRKRDRDCERDDERWAQYWARKYSWALEGRGDVDLEDLAQAARLGILRAKETCREEVDDWASHSGFVIRREIYRALGIGKDGMPPRILSLDEPLSPDGEETGLDMLADGSLPEMDAALTLEDVCRGVREAVGRLKNPRQRQGVEWVELDGETLEQAARRMGVTRERMRQLIRAAHRKLRQDRRLRALAEVELRTRYHAHMGVKAFMSGRCSAVERTVLWRLEQQERIERAYGSSGEAFGDEMM